MLCDRDKRRLVVRRSVNGREAVEACWNAVRDISGEDTIHGRRVQPLEEHELGRVRGRRAVEAGELVDHDVRVALDIPLRVHLLGRGEVVFRRVHEVSRFEIDDCHLDREVGVGLERGSVRWDDELGRRHVRHRGEYAHRRRVARPSLDLGAVRKREVRDRRAKVDEVVRGGEGGNLAGDGNVLSVVLESSSDE